MKIHFLLVSFVLFFLVGCMSGEQQELITLPVQEGSLVHDLPQVHLLEPDAFEALIADDEVFMMQTHLPYEGEIEGTDFILEDWEHVALYQDQLPTDKNAKIAVYCRSGRMSADAAEQLLVLGYTNVYDLHGGMISWKASGRNVIEK